jgi:HEPN domain-containing protein
MKNNILPSQEIKADIQIARYALSSSGNPTNDEALYNVAAYHTQQAIEKCLKFYLRDVYGENEDSRRFKTHDIMSLSHWLEDEHSHAVSMKIKKIANDLTDWESNSRYGHSLVATRNEIEESPCVKLAQGIFLPKMELIKEKSLN